MTLFASEPEIKISNKPEHQWMIIDGALLSEAYSALPSLFASQNKAIQYKAIFEQTKWHDVADVGPLLIHYHPDIEAWVQQTRPWRFGLIFESDAPMKTLIQHWLTLSDCQHPGLEGSLCRLYDAIVFYHLLNQTEENRQISWLGPMQKIWLPDYAGQQYFYAERPIAEAVQALDKVMFTDPEWQALSDAKRYATAFRLTHHVDDYFPDYWQHIDNKQQHIIEQLKNLEALGPITQQDATYYMNVLCQLGDIWNTKQPYAEKAVEWLKNQSMAMEDRLHKVTQLTQEYGTVLQGNKEVTA